VLEIEKKVSSKTVCDVGGGPIIVGWILPLFPSPKFPKPYNN